MVLRADDELSKGSVVGRLAVIRFTIRRVFTGEGVTFAPDLRELFQPAGIIFVITAFLAGEQHVQAMMKIIRPLPIAAVTAEVLRKNITGRVEVSFGDEVETTIQL